MTAFEKGERQLRVANRQRLTSGQKGPSIVPLISVSKTAKQGVTAFTQKRLADNRSAPGAELIWLLRTIHFLRSIVSLTVVDRSAESR
jgi:hypothetical protein